jgi:hypothetical protein
MEQNNIIITETIKEQKYGMPPIHRIQLATEDGNAVTLSLTPQQATLLNSRFSREFLVLCSESRFLEMIEKAPNVKALEVLAQKYSLCDICDFSDINFSGIKRMLKVIVHSLYKYPKLRCKFCYIGSPDGYRKKMSRLALGDVQTLKDFGLQYICREDIAIQLGRMMQNYAEQIVGNHEGYIAMALSAFGLFDALLFDQNDFEGYSYIKLVSDLRRSVECGFHPIGCHTPESVAYHEIGHLIDYLCGLSKSPLLLSYTMSLSNDTIVRGLSEYAATSVSELIAEAFAEYMCNESPRIISSRVNEIINREYKRIR